MAMPRGIYDYFRRKQAILRAERRRKEKEIRDAEKARVKRQKDFERAIAKAERDAEKKAEAAAKLQRLTERIETKLRKQYGLPQDGTLVVVVDTEHRRLEI